MSVDPIRRLKSMGRDVSNIPLSHVKEMRKVCFICVNCYKSYRGGLGAAPINDGVSVAKTMKIFDFEIFILQTPHARNFLNIVDKFLENTTEQLVFYYAGEPMVDIDASDEVEDYHFTFDDGTVSESSLAEHIIAKKNPSSQLYLITQRAHKGSIFDIEDGHVLGKELPPRTFSISCVRDFNSATQTLTMDNEQGIFTFTLCKQLKGIRECTPNQLGEAMRKVIANYGHFLKIGMTSPELADDPMFLPDYD